MGDNVIAFYDIHGNLPALNAALREADQLGYDTIVIGGDVATGYMPGQTIAELMHLGSRARFVMGNSDRQLVEIFDGADPPADYFGQLAGWCSRQLNRKQRDFLASFEPVVTVASTLFCHGTPRSDEELVTPLTPEPVLARILGSVSAQLVVGGHTHIQMDRRIGGKRFVNAGSIGMPYGGTGAFWLRLTPEVDLRRTEYPLETAAAAIRATGGPGAAEFAAENVLTTPSADDAAELFEEQAGRRT